MFNSIEDFVKKLQNDLKKIEKFLSKIYYNVVKIKSSWITDDFRIIDIQFVEKCTSAQVMFRRKLNQRFLIIEFNDRKKNIYGTSKIKQQTNESSMKSDRKHGWLTQYLNINKHRFFNKEMIKAETKHKTKLLVCEQLLNESKYSAIFIFKYYHFLKLKNEEFHELKNLIISFEKITMFVEQKMKWFDHCQNDYNDE